MKKNPTRREALGVVGAAGLTALVGCGAEATAGTVGTSETGGASGDAGDAGADGRGGADAAVGGKGGTGKGGVAVGGSGGTGNGGDAEGGTGKGGAAVGGTSNGGTATGGTSNGGTAAGGNGGTGGGGPVECETEEETTAGPFPNVNPLDRRDVRANTAGGAPKAGAELVLKVGVYDLDAGCAPISGAVVDIWACDAVGAYAGYSAFNTAGQDFCRGYQKTDAKGVAEFLTIFPGSYQGRALHIHFSVQAQPRDLAPNAGGVGLTDAFVSQMYFTKRIADEIFAAIPLYQDGAAITPNEADRLFANFGGASLVVKTTKNGNGYIGELQVGVRRSGIGM